MTNQNFTFENCTEDFKYEIEVHGTSVIVIAEDVAELRRQIEEEGAFIMDSEEKHDYDFIEIEPDFNRAIFHINFESEVEEAAKQFEELYAEELKEGIVTGDTIYEWFTQSKYLFPNLTDENKDEIYDQLEQTINW